MNYLIQLDHSLFFLINNGLEADWLDPIFEGFSSLGGWTIILLAIALLANNGRKVVWSHILVISIAILVVGPLNTLAKKSVARARPVKAFQKQIEDGTVEVRVIGDPVRRKSFPSGHSMLAFLTMTYVAFKRRSARIWVLVLAALVSFSRIYVGAHFPLDCLAGSAIGAAGGWAGAWAHGRLFNNLKEIE